MRLRTVALVLAVIFGLSASAEAKKKSPHSSPPTAKSMQKARVYKPKVKRQKVKPHKVAKVHH